jgi:hypothetical protein
MRPITPKSVTSREKLRQILDGVRRTGHAIVDQELELGLRSIAVPVRDAAGHVVAAACAAQRERVDHLCRDEHQQPGQGVGPKEQDRTRHCAPPSDKLRVCHGQDHTQQLTNKI